ncbi:MAG: hypothetical protein KTR16_02425 [Acidiferrobacterales bacterium]|nr:hypothetical protein [Acidiferrobacterales bacterium]
MTTNTATQTKTETNKELKSVDFFNDLDNQQIATLCFVSGVYARGVVEDYEIKDRKTGEISQGVTSFIQVLIPAREGSKSLKLKRVKVPEELRPMIDILNKQKQFKYVMLQCEVKEYQSSTAYLLTKEQPQLKLS